MSTERRLMGNPSPGRLRVLFLSSIFPNPENPTLGTFHEQLAGELGRACELQVISPLPWFPSVPGPLPDRWRQFSRIGSQYQMGGFTVSSPKYPMLPGVSESIRAALMIPGIFRQVRRLHQARPFDVMAGLWMYPDGVAASVVARLLDIPLVLVGLGCDVNVCMAEPLKRAQILSSVRRAAAVIVVDETLKTRLVSGGAAPEKIVAIPNGVDQQRFEIRDRGETARALGLSGRGRRIVFVGRLSPEKGLPTLIAAMPALVSRQPDVTLHVVGDGECRGEYEQLARQLGLEHAIRFVGAASHGDVPRWISAGDVLCLPSLREGCPNIVIEALACGRPVVGAAVGGVPALLSDETGVLVAAGDAAGFSAALERALGHSWDPAEIRRSVAARTWTQVADRYLDVFKSAAGAPDPAGAGNHGANSAVALR
jgi:glycosyltransferase involved in cell wall biosynthesis